MVSANCAPAWLMLVGALGVALSLLWDLSWEPSVGIDRVWGLPHVATYLAIALAGCGALALIVRGTSSAIATCTAMNNAIPVIARK